MRKRRNRGEGRGRWLPSSCGEGRTKGGVDQHLRGKGGEKGGATRRRGEDERSALRQKRAEDGSESPNVVRDG